MPKIGEWSLREACRQLTVWHAVCPQVRPLTVSVNFALLHFLDADLAALIQQTLRHGPRSVESEDRNY
jgi:EAL domain-containing protein (putative c-di-GMP-specific phosphodiesterase class I)